VEETEEPPKFSGDVIIEHHSMYLDVLEAASEGGEAVTSQEYEGMHCTKGIP
jgi:hypothetical protein